LEVDENSFLKWERCRKGVKGIFPLGCLPLWGREGVTLIAFLKRMINDRISTEPKNSFFLIFPGHSSSTNVPLCAPEQKNKRNPVIFGRNAY